MLDIINSIVQLTAKIGCFVVYFVANSGVDLISVQTVFMQFFIDLL